MERFTTTPENAKATLAEYGVAIVPRCIDKGECDSLFSQMWDFFEEITADLPLALKRDDPKTWHTILDLYPSHGMLFQHWGIGHAKFAWWIRQNDKVIDVFTKIWNVKPEQLLVSFDGASFQPNPDRDDNPVPNRGWGSAKGWPHTDQSLRRNGFECAQGWVTALDVEEGDATLAVMVGSHKLHGEVAKKFEHLVGSDDWVQYDDAVMAFFEEKGCEFVRITCPAGSLVLWDSRTAHYGAPPVRGRANPKFRAVAYVCYMPRSKAKPADLKRKLKHFVERRTTSHWPGKPRAFGKNPRTYGKTALPKVRASSAPVLSALGKKLAGF